MRNVRYERRAIGDRDPNKYASRALRLEWASRSLRTVIIAASTGACGRITFPCRCPMKTLGNPGSALSVAAFLTDGDCCFGQNRRGFAFSSYLSISSQTKTV